jgi:hypothetical protein
VDPGGVDAVIVGDQDGEFVLFLGLLFFLHTGFFSSSQFARSAFRTGRKFVYFCDLATCATCDLNN